MFRWGIHAKVDDALGVLAAMHQQGHINRDTLPAIADVIANDGRYRKGMDVSTLIPWVQERERDIFNGGDAILTKNGTVHTLREALELGREVLDHREPLDDTSRKAIANLVVPRHAASVTFEQFVAARSTAGKSGGGRAA